jgi:hypothetical protein
MSKNALLNRDHMQLLRGVSRSFYLSIRLLPAALQGPISVGYLLARATDTVADTTALPQAERQRLLSELLAAIEAPVGQSLPKAADLSAFAERQTDPHERALMQALPACLTLLHTLSAADQASSRGIATGKPLDLRSQGYGRRRSSGSGSSAAGSSGSGSPGQSNAAALATPSPTPAAPLPVAPLPDASVVPAAEPSPWGKRRSSATAASSSPPIQENADLTEANRSNEGSAQLESNAQAEAGSRSFRDRLNAIQMR